MRIDDISISRCGSVLAPAWKMQVEISGASLGSREEFTNLDGLLLEFVRMSVTLAAIAGREVPMPKREAAPGFEFTDISLEKSPVHADAWRLNMKIDGLEYDGWFEDFIGLRTAIMDATVFFAARAGKISHQAASRMSTRQIAPGTLH